MYWIGIWIGSFPMCYLILDIDRSIIDIDVKHLFETPFIIFDRILLYLALRYDSIRALKLIINKMKYKI